MPWVCILLQNYKLTRLFTHDIRACFKIISIKSSSLSAFHQTILVHPYLSKAFQQYQECNRGCCWSRRFQHDNQTKQTNKQLWSLIDRLTCGVCHYPFCEQDYVIVPSVNMNLMIEPDCEILIVKFKSISRAWPQFS